MRVGVRFGQESKCPRFTARSRVEGFGLKAQACSCFDKSYFFCLTDYAVFLRVSERGNGGVGYGVLCFCWDDRNIP